MYCISQFITLRMIWLGLCLDQVQLQLCVSTSMQLGLKLRESSITQQHDLVRVRTCNFSRLCEKKRLNFALGSSHLYVCYYREHIEYYGE